MDYDGVTMDKIDLEIIQVDKDICDKVTITSPERVHIKNKNTDGYFSDFPVDCVLTLTDRASGIILEYVQVEGKDDITVREERKLRKENTFVRELYEEYRVSLILAHGGNE